ncbi:MG2 domain-containing protein [Arenibacter sp. ARW7G5Y1]|uniref:MG2 domain-containing protein n=1 Tax=Arenibacter sp. ARW7G5Y1 TaxID=2135619 RepID=UPI000D75394C|nr:TonB-dependent receptor plug domain-containing protein [Arenibacter sp. ARW7G5Y1]PXX29757.1 TonB-dependent receptor-like protein [Arenibacter sp. ARW7G5Y1]
MYIKKREYWKSVFLFIFFTSALLAQKNTALNSITEKLEDYVNNLGPEKVYIQTDKDFYTIGDTIWFKSYLVNGVNHLSSDLSKVVHVEILDTNDSLVKKRKLYTDKGSVSGDIEIDDSIVEGNYHIRAYTKYMLNNDAKFLFLKEIPILARPVATNDTSSLAALNTIVKIGQEKEVPNPQISKPIVQFSPEGGNLVTGLPSGIGLNITNENGIGIALKGKIIDQDGNKINSFETNHLGVGLVSFTPGTAINYLAEIDIDGNLYRYSVPTALNQGYTMQLKNLGNHIIIKVSTNIDQGLMGTSVVGHLRGKVFLKYAKKYSDKTSYLIKFPTSKLSDGVAHFTLFNQDGEPMCERLTFVENQSNTVNLTLKTDKTNYSLREKVMLEMSLTDNHGKPLQGDFSISVAMNNSYKKDAANIKSWLLLISDMGKTLGNSNSLFNQDASISKNILDMSMLSQRWQRFSWGSLLLDKPGTAIEFIPEKGILIKGVTKAFDNPYQPRKALTTLSILGPDVYQVKSLTDTQGKFSFGPLVFFDSVEAFINASTTIPNKNEKIAIHLDTSKVQVYIDNPMVPSLHKKTVPIQKELMEYRDKVGDLQYSPRVTALSEVVVKARQKTSKDRIEEELNKMTVYGPAQNRLFPDSIPGRKSRTVFDLLIGMAGTRVIGTFPNQGVRIRGTSSLSNSGDPLYTIDGVPVTADFVQGMSVNDILFVDVLKGGEAAFFGSRGANGVVAIYTDRGRSFDFKQKENFGVTNIIVEGFYKARKFYSPIYGGRQKTDRIKSDYRTTLYWNPEIVVNDNISTYFSFFTGDVPGEFTIKVEGITANGIPVSKQCNFDIFN